MAKTETKSTTDFGVEPTEPASEPVSVVPINRLRASAPALGTGKITKASGAYNTWDIKIAAGLDRDVLLEPTFWRHHAHARAQIRTGDKIECRCEDGSWEEWFRVMYVGGGEVRLSSLLRAEHANLDIDVEDSPYRLRHIPGIGWGVSNKETGEWLIQGLADRDGAEKFRINHIRKIR